MLVVYVSVACKYIVETKEITNGRSKFYDINVKTEKKVVDISQEKQSTHLYDCLRQKKRKSEEDSDDDGDTIEYGDSKRKKTSYE